MTVKEGSATVNLPEGVFYNPVQEFNRDLTISVIKHYSKMHLQEFINKVTKTAGDTQPKSVKYPGLIILEALGASGLRSVRFANEIPMLHKIVTNDLDPEATKLIFENSKLNGVEDIIRPSCADAVKLMHDAVKDKFNIVDIDPYGTASPFLDSAVQCLFNGGLLCVTCTDMAVLCGSAAGTAYGKYGGVAIKMTAQHEQGLRLLLHAIQQAASRHDKIIEPLLSLSIDFYARVFVRVRSSASGVKLIASRLAIVYSCTGCQSFYLQRLGTVSNRNLFIPSQGPPIDSSQCPQCGSSFAVAGPLWADELHNQEFIQGLLESMKQLKKTGKVDVESMAIPDWLTLLPGVQTNPRAGAVIPGTLDRIIGMLSVAAEELPDCPFYFQSDKLCSTIRTTVPKMSLLRSAFLNAGYRVSFSHAAQSSIKTDAPVSFVWDVICAWKRKYEVEVAANKVKDISADNQKQQEKFSPPTDGANGETKPDSKKKRGKPPKKHSRSEEFLCVMNALMAKPENPKVSFEEHPDANPPSRADGLVRYQQNPQPYWGPKARPSKKVIEEITPPTPKKLKSSE